MEDAEYVVLINEGIDGSYIRQKEERARAYSVRHSVSVANVLREWWHKDLKSGSVRANSPHSAADSKSVPPAKNATSGDLGNSFDTDVFLQAALEKSMQPW